MRVLLANSARDFRGGESQTIALAGGLRRSGCEVMIVSRLRSTLSTCTMEAIPCAAFRFEAVPIATPFALARLISRWRPDILHAQTSDAHTHLWLARTILAGAPPLVVSRRVAFPIRKDLLSLLKYRTGVAHYIPISRAAAASLLGRGVSASRMTVIPSGVDVAAIAGARASEEVARRWALRRDEPVIGTVAAFEAEKGHRTLVRAAAEVLRETPRAQFILVGEGRLKAELEAEIARLGIAASVRCYPLDAPLEGMLPLFDIFVLPSLREGLSTALIAAMAAGVPVVASMTGGIPEVVSPGTGMLVPPGDERELAHAIATLVRDERLRRRMGEAGAKRGAEFDMGLTVERIMEVYRRLLGRTEVGSGD